MKLRNKLIVLFSLLILIATSSITFFASSRQKQSFIENELNFQKQTLELLHNTLSLEYYNYLYQQIMSLVEVKKKLNDTSLLLKYNLEQNNLYDTNAYLEFFTQQQKLFKNIAIDLVVSYKDEILLEPLDKDILNAYTVNKLNLNNILTATNAQSNNYQGLFNNNKSYLALAFKTYNKSDFSFALIIDVSSLTYYYDSSNANISITLQDQLVKLNHTWQGRFLIIDANTDKILVDSRVDDQNLPNSVLASLKQSVINNSSSTFIDDEQNYIFASYFKPLNWYTLTLRDKNQTISQTQDNLIIMLAIALITLCLAITSGIIFTNKLTQRLNNVLSFIKSLSHSNLQDKQVLSSIADKLQSNSKDEVAILSNTIINISLSLSDKIDELICANDKQNKIDNELHTANLIQKGMLNDNSLLPNNNYVEVYAYTETAKQVGGDLYDAFFIDDDHIGFCIGDVSDKGVPAALFMSTTLTLIRLALDLKQEPHQAMRLVNNKLAKHNPNLMFVTLIIGVLNIKTGELKYTNAGHCKPIVLKNNNEIYTLDSLDGIAAGIMLDSDYHLSSYTLNSNESLLLYTDGVSEACNNNLELYGDKRVLAYAQNIKQHEAKSIVTGLIDDIIAFRQEALASDDIAIVCIHKK